MKLQQLDKQGQLVKLPVLPDHMSPFERRIGQMMSLTLELSNTDVLGRYFGLATDPEHQFSDDSGKH